ncbi:hypothetical protein FA15DRAFT_667903 [Coprinopsis marcescibilis]|uniref:Uncharacterized protein n=1 Tax=Coprinopsis marcescibilis TaxID=230819 RepID=A0A5C3L018_COPMA|nr:hypothetical protein FA15DRAFT_667903 [Coprinopsis marcescibilis]
MPGFSASSEPSYISSHSADVILSEIRSFKLKPDALRCINVLLDEFLYNVLRSSGSLATDRLRASLLGLLPTSLGKEALLEAEVELRAYWERTAPAGIIPSADDDSDTFHLPLAFQLLRNKCEAYSTLNEADEDPLAEAQINEKFGRPGGPPLKAVLVAPAALYLTAILEAICEHVLSNVSRVATRDSSRASATVNDLFTALCEDASVYDYFRSTKVYSQIEQLSKAPKSRRSKSFTRTDKTSSEFPSQESFGTHNLSGSISRQSSDASMAPPATTGAPRSSFEKARALRLFSNGKTSLEREEPYSAHRKSASSVSEGSKTVAFQDQEPVEDAAMLQEFDNLMRSSSTMKMSLTPDRLKTMEVYKQEKEQRGNRRPAPLSFKSDADNHPRTPVNQRSQPLRHVDSITEDEDENGSSPTQLSKISRTRQASVATPPSVPFSAASGHRARSVSTSSAAVTTRKSTRSPTATGPSSFPTKSPGLSASTSASNLDMAYKKDAFPKAVNGGQSGMPPRTRVKQRNRESIDLDDIMAGSEEEDAIPVPNRQARAPVSPKRTTKVSSSTRDLMDFLAQGPPDSGPPANPISREGRQMVNFLAEGPPTYGHTAVPSEKPKTNRLQRMISKLSIGELKGKNPESFAKPLGHNRTGTNGGYPQPQHTAAPPNPLASLANRPIPPRPPRAPQPISPPSSPSQVSLAESASRKVTASQDTSSIRTTTSIPTSPSKYVTPAAATHDIPSSRPVPQTNGNDTAKFEHARDASALDTQHVLPPKPMRKPVPSVAHPSSAPPTTKITTSTTPTTSNATPAAAAPVAAPTKPSEPGVSETDARDMQRLISNATSADECRLIVDMFLTRAGIKPTTTGAEKEVPYPSPTPSLNKNPQTAVNDAALECSVVDMLLSGSGSSSSVSTPSRPARRHPRGLKPQANDVKTDSQEKLDDATPITTWKSSAEFPTHANPQQITV